MVSVFARPLMTRSRLTRSQYVRLSQPARATLLGLQSPRTAFPESPIPIVNAWVSVIDDSAWTRVIVLDRPSRLSALASWLERYAPTIHGTGGPADWSPTGRVFARRGRMIVRPHRVYVLLHEGRDV